MGPAGTADARPAVVIARVAAHIGHRVDRRRAADDLSARAFDAAVVEPRLGLGKVHPVMQPLFEDAAPADRDFDPRVPIPAAGFEEQHPRAGILRQPPRQGASGRSGADDDVVRSHFHIAIVNLYCDYSISKSLIWEKHTIRFAYNTCKICARIFFSFFIPKPVYTAIFRYFR
jgi:hypothetical protein